MAWCGRVRCDVVWCDGVAWCGVVWCVVVWRSVTLTKNGSVSRYTDWGVAPSVETSWKSVKREEGERKEEEGGWRREGGHAEMHSISSKRRRLHSF